eukprot:jgi/Chrzof1/6024/Cz17g02080.t1
MKHDRQHFAELAAVAGAAASHPENHSAGGVTSVAAAQQQRVQQPQADETQAQDAALQAPYAHGHQEKEDYHQQVQDGMQQTYDDGTVTIAVSDTPVGHVPQIKVCKRELAEEQDLPTFNSNLAVDALCLLEESESDNEHSRCWF